MSRWSRSTWACELKCLYILLVYTFHCVTLHVSVWVEIAYDELKQEMDERHAPRERVSWNNHQSRYDNKTAGHAPRERVSWNDFANCVT